MAEALNRKSIEVEFLEFEELQNVVDNEPETYYLCGSSQHFEIKRYLDDVIDRDVFANNLIPDRRLIKCHDNKGYQGLLAKDLGLKFVPQKYYVEARELDKKFVIKSISGAGSKGVILCDNKKDLQKFLHRRISERIGFRRLGYYLRAAYRKAIKKEWAKAALEYYTPKETYAVQELVKGLSHDFKVLVFMDSCFVLKRGTRDNDFRASGSGKFEFIEPEEKLLDFSRKFRVKLKSPYISLDVVQGDDGEYQCIEFQCAHFGPYTQMNAPFYYKYINGQWIKLDNDTVLEEIISESIYDFIRKPETC